MKNFTKTMGAVALAAFAAVQANGSVLFQDDFSYADGAITNVSGGIWNAHNGASAVGVSGGHAIASSALTQDVNADLLGAPISGTTFFMAFDHWLTALPTGTSGYFLHFKDNTTFNFVGRTFAVTNAATPGKYGMGVSVNAGSAGVWTGDLTLGTTNKIVVKFDNTNPNLNEITLWINPTLESDPNVSITGTGLTNLPIYEVAIRQSTAMGINNLDNLVIGTEFGDVVIPEPSTAALIGFGLLGMALFARRKASRG